MASDEVSVLGSITPLIRVLVPAPRNMKSAAEHPAPVDRYLREEVGAGRNIGPLPEEFRAGIQISRFGVIPKPHQAGKLRLITDLSSPAGSSVNDGVDALIILCLSRRCSDVVKASGLGHSSH